MIKQEKRDLAVLASICKKYKCGDCPLIRNETTWCCEFKRSPRYWNIEKIKRVIKKELK
jgi:hypothetical protein